MYMCVCRFHDHWLLRPWPRSGVLRWARLRQCLWCYHYDQSHCESSPGSLCSSYPVQVCLSVCVSVCLSVRDHISSPELHIRSWPNSLCMLPMAVARSSSGGVLICYVFPVLWMTSYLHSRNINGFWLEMWVSRRTLAKHLNDACDAAW